MYKWTNTDVEEIHNWLGLVLWMGLVQLPEVGLYWIPPYFLQTLGTL